MGTLTWLASYPHSGTPLLRYFLYAYLRLDPKSDGGIDPEDPGFARFFTEDARFDWWRPLVSKTCEEMKPTEISLRRRASQEMIAAAAEGGVFVETHSAFVKDHGVQTLMPHVTNGAIYVIRNPLNVAISLKAALGLETMGAAIRALNDERRRIPSSETHVATLTGSWRRSVDSWVGRKRTGVFALRYEDMIEDPVKAFRYVVELLGMTPDEDRLAWAAGAAMAAGAEDPVAIFEGGVEGLWRERLNPEQTRAIIAHNHEMMAHCGYLTEDLARFAPKNGAKRRA